MEGPVFRIRGLVVPSRGQRLGPPVEEPRRNTHIVLRVEGDDIVGPIPLFGRLVLPASSVPTPSCSSSFRLGAPPTVKLTARSPF